MKNKVILARELLINGNAYIVKKKFKSLPSGGCTICGEINNLTTYVVQPKELLSSKTYLLESKREETWKTLPSISMPLCNQCVIDNSRHRIIRWVFLIPLFLFISIASFALVQITRIDTTQSILKIVGVIASLGTLITIICIHTFLPDKIKKPQSIDGQVCVRDLIKSQYADRRYEIHLPSPQELCQHIWIFDRKAVQCSKDSLRGSGPYNDPCYGVSCPCDDGSVVNLFVCSKCGAERTENLE